MHGALIADEKYYMRMLDALPECVVRYSLPGLTILYCNAAWAAGHKVEPAGVIGRNLADFLSASESSGLGSQLARLGSEHPFLADDRPAPLPMRPVNGWSGSINTCPARKGQKCLPSAGT